MKKSKQEKAKATREGDEAPASSNLEAVQEGLEALMKRVRKLEPGGDLEGLIEEAASGLKRELYRAAARERTQAAARAAFPPSAMREV